MTSPFYVGEKRIQAYLSDRGSPCRFNYVVADKMELPTRITPPLGVLPRLAPNESPKTRSPSIAYFNSKVIAYDAGCYSQPSCRVRFKIARGIDMMLGDSFGKTSDSDRLDRLMISDRARSMLVGTSLMKEPADNRLAGGEDGSDCRRRARSLEDKALDPQIQIFLLRKGKIFKQRVIFLFHSATQLSDSSWQNLVMAGLLSLLRLFF
nr:hypothetical protein Iba_chr05fCG9020 [Ipomoea batatas]